MGFNVVLFDYTNVTDQNTIGEKFVLPYPLNPSAPKAWLQGLGSARAHLQSSFAAKIKMELPWTPPSLTLASRSIATGYSLF